MSLPRTPRTPHAPVAVPRSVLDPPPRTVERGPVARLQWRAGVESDPALASVATPTEQTPLASAWAGILAETHAHLLDPAGTRGLERPDPIAASVIDAMRSSDHWPILADAARSHPVVARDAVRALADVARAALAAAGARADTDAARALDDLERARKALAEARAQRKAADASGTTAERRAAMRAETEADAAEQRAAGAVAAIYGIARRAATECEGEAAGAAIARAAEAAGDRAQAVRCLDAALGDGQGVGGQRPPPDEIVRAITPAMRRVLALVGAMRPAIREGRSARHVKGREGMIGVATGGLARIADLTMTARAALAGGLGAGMRALALFDLVEGRAAVVEKGGGHASTGDVVVVVDKSGSMRGTREEWAAALAIAIILEARREDRRAALVTYDGTVRRSVIVDSPATMLVAIAAACESSGGDNNEHAALVRAVSVLRSLPHQGDGADIVMLTDGQWKANNLAGVDLTGVRLRGVFIGGAAPVGSAAFASTWGLEDDVLDTETAVEIAHSVV